MLYRRAIYPALVRLGGGDPETAHERVLAALAFVSRSPALTRALDIAMSLGQPDTASLAREVFGLRFPHPVGLAAGFDKNGVALHALAALGFGFVEAGTITRVAQPGNPRPRLFRLLQDRGAHQPHGLQQRRRGGRGGATQADATIARPAWPQPGQVEGHAAGRRRRRLSRLARRALSLWRLLRRQRQLAQHAGAARSAGRRPAGRAARSPDPAPA